VIVRTFECITSKSTKYKFILCKYGTKNALQQTSISGARRLLSSAARFSRLTQHDAPGQWKNAPRGGGRVIKLHFSRLSNLIVGVGGGAQSIPAAAAAAGRN
jgi:hypothetical protein